MDSCVLVESPLACVVLYCQGESSLSCYSLNGQLLSQVSVCHQQVVQPQVMSTSSGQSALVTLLFYMLGLWH